MLREQGPAVDDVDHETHLTPAPREDESDLPDILAEKARPSRRSSELGGVVVPHVAADHPVDRPRPAERLPNGTMHAAHPSTHALGRPVGIGLGIEDVAMTIVLDAPQATVLVLGSPSMAVLADAEARELVGLLVETDRDHALGRLLGRLPRHHADEDLQPPRVGHGGSVARARSAEVVDKFRTSECTRNR